MSDEKRKTTFADVRRADEEKKELREIVEFLKNPNKYTSWRPHSQGRAAGGPSRHW